MREIKFRVWNSNLQQIIPTPLIGGLDRIKYLNLYLSKPSSGIDKEILMQYTGLKDKNGTEIYESDYIEFKIFDKKYIKECVFSGGMFGVSVPEQTTLSTLLKLTALDDIHIIGNIYENR